MAKKIKEKKEVEFEEPIIELNTSTETESQFLERLLKFQHNGGWGKHLDHMVMERMKVLSGTGNKMWMVDGKIVTPDAEPETPKEWLE